MRTFEQIGSSDLKRESNIEAPMPSVAAITSLATALVCLRRTMGMLAIAAKSVYVIFGVQARTA